MVSVMVVGQVARDLVLRVQELRPDGESTPVCERRETLGGKGANQAVGLAQLGTPVGLLGVVGDDEVADRLLEQGRADGVDVGCVVRRSGTRSGLIVDVLEAGGGWRYLEDLPDGVLLTEGDVAQAAERLRAADATVVQLQQPSGAALAAVRCAREAGRMVVLDGVPADDHRRKALLAGADVLRADAREGELLIGGGIGDADDAVQAGVELRRRYRLGVVVLGVADWGDVFVWDGGHAMIPHVENEVVDTTGAGDALVAGLTSVLCRGGPPHLAARLGVAAAAATVGHAGGRPNLTPHRVEHYLQRLDAHLVAGR